MAQIIEGDNGLEERVDQIIEAQIIGGRRRNILHQANAVIRQITNGAAGKGRQIRLWRCRVGCHHVAQRLPWVRVEGLRCPIDAILDRHLLPA